MPVSGGIIPERYKDSTPPVGTMQRNMSSLEGFFSSSGRAKAEPALKVALLVPLSGSYSELGRTLLDASQMALFSLRNSDVALLPFDTKGTPLGASEAAKEALNQGVGLILGPVFSRDAKAINPIAAAKGIPVITFSNDMSLAGSGVYAVGMRPEGQIRTVLAFAYAQGIRQFSALFPNDVYGGAAAETLRLFIAEHPDAHIRKTEFYRRDKEGMPIHLPRLVNAIVQANLQQEAVPLEGNALRAILIPEGREIARQAIRLIVQHPLYDKEKIQILGAGQWNEFRVKPFPDITGAWYAGVPEDAYEDFHQRFESLYHYTPPEMASLAYDVTSLAVALSRSVRDGRIDSTLLQDSRGFSGVEGIFRFRSDGMAERGFAVLKFAFPEVETLAPAPKEF